MLTRKKERRRLLSRGGGIADLSVTTAPANTGWYGDIVMELESIRPSGETVSYNYTIYRGSTTSAPVLANNLSITNNLGNGVVVPQSNRIDIGDRLENSSSTFLVVVNRSASNNGDLAFNGVSGATNTFNPGFFNSNISPASIGTPVLIRFYIS